MQTYTFMSNDNTFMFYAFIFQTSRHYAPEHNVGHPEHVMPAPSVIINEPVGRWLSPQDDSYPHRT